MKVHELIHILNELDPQATVVLLKDEEGNGFYECQYVELCAWDGDETIGLSELTGEDIENGYTEEDVIEDGVEAVVLWP